MKKLDDITITTQSQELFLTPMDKCLYKSIFVINNGENAVTVQVYGSPSGVRTGDRRDRDGSQYTAAEAGRHYYLVATLNVGAHNNAYADLSDYVYDYFKGLAYTATGESSIQFSIQKQESLQ